MVTDLSARNFGVVIAFLIPGFVTLWGVSLFSPTVDQWLHSSAQTSPTVAGFLYVTLASLAAGLTVSAVRWAVIDTLHHATGIKPPTWDFTQLDDRLHGFLALVENHYRYYQFYANMAVAVSATYSAKVLAESANQCQPVWQHLGFVLLEVVFLAGSRDSLRKYYRRVEQLLPGSRIERNQSHDERFSCSETTVEHEE